MTDTVGWMAIMCMLSAWVWELYTLLTAWRPWKRDTGARLYVIGLALCTLYFVLLYLTEC